MARPVLSLAVFIQNGSHLHSQHTVLAAKRMHCGCEHPRHCVGVMFVLLELVMCCVGVMGVLFELVMCCVGVMCVLFQLVMCFEYVLPGL